MAYKLLSDHAKSQSRTLRCSAHTVDSDPWIWRLLQGQSRDHDTSAMKSLSALAPCVFEEFSRQLRLLWTEYRRHSPMLRYLSPERRGPFVNLDSFPLLFLPPTISKKKKRAESEVLSTFEGPPVLFEETSKNKEGENGQKEQESSRLLVSVLPSLPHLLFPLFTGQFMLVCGGELRRQTVVSLITKLRSLVPCAESSAGSLCRKWHEGRVPPTAFADFKLFGIFLARGEDTGSIVASNIRPFLSVLDMNSDVYHSCKYKGKLLQKLSQKTASLFPSDRALIPYIRSLLGDYAMLSYVLYHFVYCDHETYRKNVKYLARFAEKLGLDASDMKIIRYFVELIKQQLKDQTRLEGAFESLFLEHEPSKPFKL